MFFSRDTIFFAVCVSCQTNRVDETIIVKATAAFLLLLLVFLLCADIVVL